MMNYEPTRLYYSTDTEDGKEVLEVRSVSMESQRYNVADVDAMPVFTYRDAGKLVFTVRGNAADFVNLFHSLQRVNWLIEMPNAMTFMFQGYVEAIDQSLGAFDDVSAKIAVRIAGPINSYYDGPGAPPDTSDVFSRKASRAQSKVVGEVLRRVL